MRPDNRGDVDNWWTKFIKVIIIIIIINKVHDFNILIRMCLLNVLQQIVCVCRLPPHRQ